MKNKARVEELDYHRLLNVSIGLGVLLLENGAEIYRVEESIQRILHAYGVKKVDLFAIPTLIIVSIEDNNNKTLTKTKRLHSRSTNFDRVNVANDYIRYVCNKKPPLDDVLDEINAIKERPVYGFMMHLFSATLVGFSFTLFFNGTISDALVAMFAVLFARIVGVQMERFHANSFYITVVASFIHTAIASTICLLFPELHLDRIIMGTLMILVPGVAFTTALRDIIARDLLAGMVAGLEALLIASAIAIGSALAYWTVAEGWNLIA